MKRGQALAESPRLRLLLHCDSDLIRRQRQAVFRQTRQLLAQRRDARRKRCELMFIAGQLGKMRAPASNLLAPQAEPFMLRQPLRQYREFALKLFMPA